MKKLNLINVCLLTSLIVISVIYSFYEHNLFSKMDGKIDLINKEIGENRIVDLIKQDQLDTEEIIARLELQLNTKITELTTDTGLQNRNIVRSFYKLKISNLERINEVKDLITHYTEEAGADNVAKNQIAINTLAESDVSNQDLLNQGFSEYENGEFAEAVRAYGKILDTDPTNTAALLYYNASLYYLNPGDDSSYHTAKKNLVPLLETKDLLTGEQRTILDVLIGISREEGDTASLDKYQQKQKQMEGGSQ